MIECEICSRTGEPEYFEKHHLIPKNKSSHTIMVCHQCGDQIHVLFSNNQLKNQFNTTSLLRSHPKMRKFIEWVRNKPLNRHFTTAKKKRKI